MDKATLDKKSYEAFHAEFGLKPEWLGKTFEDRGQTFKIVGLNPRSKNFPVLTTGGFRFSAPYVVALMTNSMDKYKQKEQADCEKKHAAMLKQARTDFAVFASDCGVPKTWLNKTFKTSRKTYTVVGLKGGSKYPVVAQTSDGKVMFFTVEYLKNLLKHAA